MYPYLADFGITTVESFFDNSVGGKGSSYQTDYPQAAPPAVTATIDMASGSALNTAAIVAAGFKVPSALPEPQVTAIALAKAGDQLVAVPTTYSSGPNLP